MTVQLPVAPRMKQQLSGNTYFFPWNFNEVDRIDSLIILFEHSNI